MAPAPLPPEPLPPRIRLSTSRYVTGYHVADLLLLLLLGGSIVFLAPRLRVYYSVTVIEVTADRVEPDGHRVALPTTDRFRHIGEGYTGLSSVVRQVERRVDAFMAELTPQEAGAPGTRYEWEVRYGRNTMRLDHQHRIVREVGARGE